MSPVRILPHQTVDDYRVLWGAWWHVTPEGVREPLGDHLQAWDYAQAITVSCDVQLDVAGSLTDAGLHPSAVLGLAATWDCPYSLERGVSIRVVDSQPSGAPWEGELLLTVPAGRVAQHLILERHLILHRPSGHAAELTAQSCGARLGPYARDRLVLEGTGGRFPVEPADFSALGREQSPWALEVSYEDPNDAFLGAVRLLVNTRHPGGRAVLEAREPGLVSVLRYDLIRKLLLKAAEEIETFRLVDAWDEESLGGVLAEICTSLLGIDLQTALARMRSDPLEFESLLQARVGFLETAEGPE